MYSYYMLQARTQSSMKEITTNKKRVYSFTNKQMKTVPPADTADYNQN